MNWLMTLLGLWDPLRKKRKQLSNLRTQAMMVQRNGDLRTFAELTKKADELEDEIIALQNSTVKDEGR